MKSPRHSLPLLPAVLAAALLLTACATQTAAPEKDFTLTLLHTGDVHGAYGGQTAEGHSCYQPKCPGGKGGSVRLDQAVRAIRRQAPDALLLDSGDQFQGTLFWTEYKEAPTIDVLNKLGYTATLPGNHEFDDGNKPFLNLVKSLKNPVLAANLSFDPPQDGGERIRPWVVVDVKGRKVGIIGVANEETPTLASPGPEARFSSQNDAVRKAVAELTRQGVDIVVALSHIGLDNDRRMAKEIAGLDVIVGGHSHSLLSNLLKNSEGPYPIVEKTPEGKPAIIIANFIGGPHLGRIEASFDEAGVPVAWVGEPIVLDDNTLKVMNAPAVDEEMVALVEKYAVPLRKKMEEPVGRIDSTVREGLPLETPRVTVCREVECLSGNVVADSLLKIPFPDAQVVLLNGGTMRSSLPSGAVSAGHVLGTLPFQNTPQIGSLPGSVIRQALEHGVSTYGEGGGRFLQVAGLRYTFDPKKPAGERVVKAEVQVSGQWRPLDAKASYRVVASDYLTRGGDGFAMLVPFEWKEAQGLMAEILRVYLERHSPLEAREEGRIKRAK
jgi:5'-nucleotidase